MLSYTIKRWTDYEIILFSIYPCPPAGSGCVGCFFHKGFLYFSGHAPWIKDNFEGEILNNSSFDQTAVLYVVEGGVGEYWKKVSGHCIVEENGDNSWKKQKNTNQSYLRLKESPEKMAEIIEAIMLNRFTRE